MKILITGDFFYSYHYLANDFKKIISEVDKYDKAFINFEGSFKSTNKRKKSVLLSMSDIALNLPKNTILILCNNHISDYGKSGVKKTLKKIKLSKLNYFGINKNIRSSGYNKNFKINEKKIFIASLGWLNEECIGASENNPGVMPFNEKSISKLKKIIKIKKDEFKILYIHAGYEWEKFPIPEHVGLARFAIDSGFDLVYFCHSHMIQEYEFYKGKLIHYGLGNFYFSSMRENFPTLADQGKCLVLKFNLQQVSYYYRIIKYDRKKKISIILKEKILKKKKLIYEDLEEYSKKYKDFRLRKKNPRPILYYKKDISNYLKFKTWKFIVDILGFLRIRPLVKKILRWN